MLKFSSAQLLQAGTTAFVNCTLFYTGNPTPNMFLKTKTRKMMKCTPFFLVLISKKSTPCYYSVHTLSHFLTLYKSSSGFNRHFGGRRDFERFPSFHERQGSIGEPSLRNHSGRGGKDNEKQIADSRTRLIHLDETSQSGKAENVLV